MVRFPSHTLLSMRGVSKGFQGVQALKNVDLVIQRGEVHCLLGENGAGKSTLMKILAGSYLADSGEIWMSGQPLQMNNPSDGIQAGIAVIYQELDLFSDLTVAQNIFMGHSPSRLGVLSGRRRRERAQGFINRVGGRFRPDDTVAELPIADQQLTAIARALAMEAMLIVMDEPTATLGEGDVEKVFAVVRSLIAEGRSVVYISHRLNEVKEIGDRITVLRDGRRVASYDVATSDSEQWTADMIGDKKNQLAPAAARRQRSREVVLEVHGVSIEGLLEVEGLSVGTGEIVGLAGLGGSGRTTLLSAIYGARKANFRGRLLGAHYAPRSVRSAVQSGVGLVPESRKRDGLFLTLSVVRNAAISSLYRAPWLWPRTVGEARVGPHLSSLGVKFSSGKQAVGELSGGNQQKVVLAKWLTRGVKLLLLDEPTRGLDVGAKAELYREVRALAEQGTAVLVASSELGELMAHTQRIVVLHQGRKVSEFDPAVDSEELINHAIISGRRK